MILNTVKTPKHKINSYVKKYRFIEIRSEFYINESKIKLNFKMLA